MDTSEIAPVLNNENDCSSEVMGFYRFSAATPQPTVMSRGEIVKKQAAVIPERQALLQRRLPRAVPAYPSAVKSIEPAVMSEPVTLEEVMEENDLEPTGEVPVEVSSEAEEEAQTSLSKVRLTFDNLMLSRTTHHTFIFPFSTREGRNCAYTWILLY